MRQNEDTLTWQVIKTGQPLYLYREKLKEQLANLNIPEEVLVRSLLIGWVLH